MARTDHLALCSGEQRTVNLCHACAVEYNDYTMRALNPMPDGLSQQQQLAAIEKLLRDTEQHMKQWVSKRKSP